MCEALPFKLYNLGFEVENYYTWNYVVLRMSRTAIEEHLKEHNAFVMPMAR